MKVVLGEYGRVTVIVTMLMIILTFLFGRKEQQFIGLLSKLGPNELFQQEDTFELSKEILSRGEPNLEVSIRKLKRGESYNLLESSTFLVEAKNEEGVPVRVFVAKLIDPEGNEITEVVTQGLFTPVKIGVYEITYRAEELYKGSVKAIEKKYDFLVN